MANPTAFYYSDGMLKYQFGPDHPSQPIRYRLIKETLEGMGVFGEHLVMMEPKPGGYLPDRTGSQSRVHRTYQGGVRERAGLSR